VVSDKTDKSENRKRIIRANNTTSAFADTYLERGSYSKIYPWLYAKSGN
jgi:hypothetical protein